MGGMSCASLLLAWNYIIGSIFFLGGSILFHPFFSSNDPVYKFGVAQFIAGSALFLIPAIYEWKANFHALSVYEREPTSPPPSIEELNTLVVEQSAIHENYHMEKHAVNMTRSTVSVLNGVLFVVGSVAYWPDFGRTGVVTGNWLFRMGSSFTLMSCTWAFYRCFQPSHHTPKMVAMLKVFYFQYILGAAGFLTGGAFFLAGNAIIGSIIWALGSVFFITGSFMLLVM
eukprot:TRINITY_DN6647_c0_g1_i1.p1 TRINITY_DN6647_c0_g1~~TRINITY_DN6647_c0_g1_i1.p1  ORF type:complete len:246 (-),score=48.22 TRINITY_DN6647_c0_g1_i1:14-697(-)